MNQSEKRTFSTRVHLNKEEQNNANAKMNKLECDNLPELIRLAINLLDVDLAEENSLLKIKYENAQKLNEERYLAIQGLESDLKLATENTEYWRNYGKDLIEQGNQKDAKITSQLQIIEREQYRINVFSDAAKNIADSEFTKVKSDEYTSVDEMIVSVLSLVIPAFRQRDEFEKLLHDETSLANKHLHTSVEKEKAFTKDLERLVSTLGTDLKEVAAKSFAKKVDELSVGDILCVIDSKITALNTESTEVKTKLEYAKSINEANQKDLAQKEHDAHDALVRYHQLVWDYNHKPIRKIWWERVKRFFSKKEQSDASTPTTKG